MVQLRESKISIKSLKPIMGWLQSKIVNRNVGFDLIGNLYGTSHQVMRDFLAPQLFNADFSIGQ